MEKVNLFIVGAMKSGITSLYEYLMQHNDIFLPKEKKEMNYFATIYQKIPHTDKNAYDLHDKKLVYTEEEYEKFYSKRKHEKILADVSPEYLYYYQCAEDIYEYNKNAKIIILFRNPVNRAFSAYTHLRRDLSEENSFIDAFMQSAKRKERNYVALYDLLGVGLYADAVEKYINIFGKENIKVIIFEEFINNTQKMMNGICEFLDINPMQFDCSVKYYESGIIQDKKRCFCIYFLKKSFIESKSC